MFASDRMSRQLLVTRTRAALALCAALCVVGVTLGSAQARRPRQLVTVMSYNIFQGSELSHVFTISSLSQLGPAVAQDYQNVIRSNIPARAKALAAEIKTNQPAVIGLQEAVLWRIHNPAGTQAVAIPGNATQVSYDFVSSVVRALAARRWVRHIGWRSRTPAHMDRR